MASIHLERFLRYVRAPPAITLHVRGKSCGHFLIGHSRVRRGHLDSRALPIPAPPLIFVPKPRSEAGAARTMGVCPQGPSRQATIESRGLVIEEIAASNRDGEPVAHLTLPI
jgi:hypothetical protein